MSTYYYLVCETHKEYCPAYSSSGGATPLGDSIRLLPLFIKDHRDCTLKVFSEHEDVYTEFGEFKST